MYAKLAVPAPIWPYDSVYDYKIPEDLVSQVEIGSVVHIKFRNRKTIGIVLEINPKTSVPISKIKEINKLVLEDFKLSTSHLDLAKHLSHYYFYNLGDVLSLFVPSFISSMSDKLLSKYQSQEKKHLLNIQASDLELNSEQRLSLDNIQSTTQRHHYLWGVTGSGKTEVYLSLIEDNINRGHTSLVLVPEISLTPQLLHRFEKRFPEQVAMFHSKQKKSAYREDWLDVFYGNKKIVIGARSALFAPMNDLSLIIVDEEHDSSYKQEEKLRYNARDSAIHYANMLDAKIVLASATPSTESIFRIDQGTMSCHYLKQRAVEKATLPLIEVVDLKKNIEQKNFRPQNREEQSDDTFSAPKHKGDFFISDSLHASISDCLSADKQAILFLNRRGYGSQHLCTSCGHTLMCPSCDIALVPHYNRLKCHYCDFQQEGPDNCPECHSPGSSFKDVGIGTQRIEELVNLHFPEAKTLRLDQDSTEKRGQLEDTLSLFKNREADILIGTQMVAKGHDFPDVTLVGIILADQGLSIPDYKCLEKSLHLLLQVSGRAGRSVDQGKVILQTFQPQHPLLSQLDQLADIDHYKSFMQAEIAKREVFHYPPTSQLCLLRIDSLSQQQAANAAALISTRLNSIPNKPLIVLGPAPCPMPKLKNRYRFQVLLKSQDSSALEKCVNWLLAGWHTNKLERKYQSRLVIDRDPVNSM